MEEGTFENSNREIDRDVFPGENLFLYWKTSASLWESKIGSYYSSNYLVVPIYWGLHQSDQQFDFGENRPETDLKRLVDIGEKYSKKIIFLLPYSPSPIFPNGGIPHHLAKCLSLSSDDIAQVYIDSHEDVKKHYSFFEPEVFQSFGRYLFNLKKYFQKFDIYNEVVALDSGYIFNGKYESYLIDHSRAFSTGFEKYLSVKFEGVAKNELSLNDKRIAKNEYQKMIQDLYLDLVRKNFPDNLSATIRSAFLGGNPLDIFYRSDSRLDEKYRYFQQLERCLNLNVIPFSTLLNEESKNGVLRKSINNYINQRMYFDGQDEFEDDFSECYQKLILFELVEILEVKKYRQRSSWRDYGLIEELTKKYKGSYLLEDKLKEFNEETDLDNRVLFISGDKISEKYFRSSLKNLFLGRTIILDENCLNESLQKKLNVFIEENDIEVDFLNYIIPTKVLSLGDSVIFLFNSEELLKQNFEKRVHYWSRILSLLNRDFLQVEEDEELFHYWLKRNPFPNELNFGEVRRLFLSNPSSYNKKAHIALTKKFVLKKVLDEENVTVENGPMGIGIKLKPGGSLILEFGYLGS